jgi:P-type conjugative transfer protein TrbJ
MTLRCLRRAALISTALATLSLASGPAGGQVIVYDPSNYVQNVLQAARALQQINNQITSLQNQTQMLLELSPNLGDGKG